MLYGVRESGKKHYNMKKVLFIISLAVAQLATAQDIIVTKQSEKIDAKIIKVTDTEIEYKKYNNLEGPTFSLSTSKINTIIYSNGDVQAFNVAEEKRNSSSSRYTSSNSGKKDGYKSALSIGFSMPVIHETYDDHGFYSETVNMYGFHIGYIGKMPFNDYFAFRHGELINCAFGDGGHMLDLKIPLLAEVGTTFENDMGVYFCAGPQILFGLSLGNEFFDYSEYVTRFDIGITIGGGINFSKFVEFDLHYTFGLIDRNSVSYVTDKVNFLIAGFNFYL